MFRLALLFVATDDEAATFPRDVLLFSDPVDAAGGAVSAIRRALAYGLFQLATVDETIDE